MAITDPEKLLSISVQNPQPEIMSQMISENPIVMYFASVADTVPAWPSKARDLKLRQLWKEEPMLAGAVFSMCAKLCALDYKMTGPARSVNYSNTILQSADLGSGWVYFLMKMMQDIFTTDNGGFMELGRRPGASSTSIPAAIGHLDSARCRHTGNPLIPVQYEDQRGTVHDLPWFSVRPIADMPTPQQELRGWGYCAVSRVLRAAQILRDIGVYKRQKLSGKRVPGMLFVQGIRRGIVKEAITNAMVQEQEQEGRSLYTGPVILSSNDAGMPVDAKLIELAGLPDGYDEDTTFKWYISALALGFGTHYSEFAPLPGGNLGTASQVEQMSDSARGKGPGLIVQLFEYNLNYFVLPETVTFQFTSTESGAERIRVELAHARARERALRVNSGEITPQQALQIAVSAGDAPESFLDTVGEMNEPGTEVVERIVRSTADLRQSFDAVQALIARRKL